MGGRRSVPLFYPAWCLRPATPLECCRRVEEAGFDGASFLVAPIQDPRRLDLLSETEAAELREALLGMGLDRSLHVGTSEYIDRADDLGAAVALLKRHTVACVVSLSGPGLPPLTVTLDPPLRWHAGEPWQPAELADDLVGFLADLTDRYEVRAGLENWPFLPVGTPEALAVALAAGKGKVGVLLDAGHAHVALTRGWCQQRDMGGFVRALPAPIAEVHFHDNHGERDEHLMPGKGTADLRGLLEAVSATGFRGPITIECDLEAEGCPGLAAGLAQIRAQYGL